MEAATDRENTDQVREMSRRSRKKLWWGLGAGAAAVLCCGGIGVYTISLTLTSSSDDNAVNMDGCGDGETVEIEGPLPQVQNLNPEQMENAAVIVQVGQNENIPPRGWIIATATAMQESTLHNYDHLGDRNDHDSLGLFQQRPSTGWGTPDEITDPAHASKSFYSSLKKVDGWEEMDLTLAAQKVQKSAFPDAYAKWEPLASDVVNALTDGGARSSAVDGEAGTCAEGTEVASSGWASPVDAGIVSDFRTPERPDHYGVDLGSQKGDEIYAAAGGVVTTAECNAFAPDGSPYSCDVDGSPQIQGCGWYVDIQHADGILTRYCHMVEEPQVKPGQRIGAGEMIGITGTSGNSSGPHLHFEVHTGEDASNAGAIDPVPWMQQQGITFD